MTCGRIFLVVLFSLVLFTVHERVSFAEVVEICTEPNDLAFELLPGSCDPEWDGDPAKCLECFRPRFDFPKVMPAEELVPWRGIDFTEDSELFLQAALQYALEGFEGQNRGRWDVYQNPVRRWYHAPWMHPHDVDGSGQKLLDDPNDTDVRIRTGREYMLGLTEELTSFPYFLGPNQPQPRTNWAVSFFNESAAFGFFQVWNDGSDAPRLSKHVDFPPGSVFVKPLYTTATEAEVPFLEGAPTAIANVNVKPFEVWNRTPTQVRLVQFDIAIKIDAGFFSSVTGLNNTFTWVYMTYVYNGLNSHGRNDDPWDRLVPVGISWGNDPTITDCGGGKLTESKVFLNVTDLDIDPNLGRADNKPCHQEHFGRQGRLNGPVDGVTSSCISCHGAAQFRRDKDLANPAVLTSELFRAPWPGPWKDGTITDEQFWSRDRCLFLNRSASQPLGDPDDREPYDCFVNDDKYMVTDTSLQMAFGLSRYCKYVTARSLDALRGRSFSEFRDFFQLASDCAPSLRREEIWLEGVQADLSEEEVGSQLQTLQNLLNAFPSNLPAKGWPYNEVEQQ